MQKIIAIAKEAALEAGKTIRSYFKSEYEIKEKGYKNPVTTADLKANEILKKILSGSFPDYGWLSEETKDDSSRLNARRTWVVDPLDGTKEFIMGLPEFVISIGLVENGRPILGILYNPVHEELFLAADGYPSTLNGNPLHLSEKTDLLECTILNSRTETRNGLWAPYSDKFSELIPMGSVAYKLGCTAAGRADLFVSLAPKNEWDVCAGDIIIRNAGGVFSDRAGNSVSYNREKVFIPNGVIAGNPALHRKAVELFSNTIET